MHFQTTNTPLYVIVRKEVLQDKILDWVMDLFPFGSPSLYGGWAGYTLVSVDDVSPGLAFNSQNATFSKWRMNHNSELQWHDKGTISNKIDDLLQKHPKLKKCVIQRNAAQDVKGQTIQYGWFNVFCVPGWGERFKQNEQVLCTAIQYRPPPHFPLS
jgi:hypothetical protein